MTKRKTHLASFKTKVALETLKGELTVPQIASKYGVHPTMIHQWKRTFLEGASDVFERGAKKKGKEKQDQHIRELHAKIGELAVANDFLSGKLKPWINK